MKQLISSSKATINRLISILISKNPRKNRATLITSLVILGVWLAAVILLSSTHEFWRDEVRALSLAQAANSPFHLAELTRYDGHPLLWYLLLYFGQILVDTPLVLPVASITIAFAAVTVLLFYAPFPLWFKTLYIYSSFPFFEYAVKARNYGISMLLLFIFAALYPKRAKHPYLLAFILALLANSNVHSAILVCILAAVWVWQTLVEHRSLSPKVLGGSFYLSILMIASGIALCLATTLPRQNSILFNPSNDLLMAIPSSFRDVALHPTRFFSQVIPFVEGPVDVILIFMVILGLLPCASLVVAAFAGQVSFGMFFDLVVEGKYWHQGLFLVFLLSLYWIALNSPRLDAVNRIKRKLLSIGLYVSFLVFVVNGLFQSYDLVMKEIREETSSSKAFGTYLNESDLLREAILVPEPDYLIESLPYYASNQIYLPREQRFSKTVSWTTDAAAALSMSDLLSTANGIHEQYDQPVLIVLGHRRMDEGRSREISFSYNKTFAWTHWDFRELHQTTELIAEFNAAANDEKYKVYMLK
jgi:hypothetical protein